MARRDDFNEKTMHCVVCTAEMPDNRRKNAITCSPECTVARRNYWLSKQDAKMCRYCYKPSTPEQRALFQQWRRRPQNAEEEELFRLWREDQTKTDTIKTRRANKATKVIQEAEAQEEEASL